ncbi:enoyl-CoA hydratase/isomerase family protein [Dactylosporangium sucinum]|uniref:Enoyl-CoA hydratase n=1 Tax=Dactylosporangium sucinum TaxID=1424081 RepID=A0A917TZE6_9ACTN|nr:enoyl-CoA hydratase/isomerase family protein [Dactylosporangium sucinum]GGM46123.1 enoyl-CoA hydratase [Dactylosporangium sucinum]
MTTVRFTAENQVLRVVLDGPGAMNSITPDVVAGLNAALDAAERDTSLRAIVVTGVGRAFSVGMDIDFLGACFADPGGTFVPFIRGYHRLLDRLQDFPVPSIAAVNGLARAGGFELLLACDFVVAADEARVGDIHLGFGMVPGAGASMRAHRKLGDQRARALLLTPTWLDGPRMVQWGLAIAHAPLADLAAEVAKITDSLRGRSRPAIATVKALLNAAGDLPLAEGLRLEREMFSRFLDEVPDMAEGYRAFVEKREPQWGNV